MLPGVQLLIYNAFFCEQLTSPKSIKLKSGNNANSQQNSFPLTNFTHQ